MDIFEQVAEMKWEATKVKVVKYLLTDKSLSVEKIASLVEVPVDFVKKLKRSRKK